MPNDWEIKSRSHHCTATGKPFAEGDIFYTLLFRDPSEGYRREDLCEEAFSQRNDNIQPFSLWRSKFEPPPPPAPETFPKATAEDLLRRVIEEDNAADVNLRYILAVMLERKKILKPVDRKETDSGPLIIYEHAKTGEIFLIPDPQLRLDQIEQVQEEVGQRLGMAPEPNAAPAPVAADTPAT